MKLPHDLLSLLDQLLASERDKSLSLRIITETIGLKRTDGKNWIKEFGDPLTSLPGAKAVVEHLGFDWHEAMSAAAAALESKGPWLLPELAQHIIAGALRRMIEGGSGFNPGNSTRH